MAIFRCNKCALLLEQSDALARQTVPCPQCASPTLVYPTLFYIEKLVEKYFDSQKELGRLRASLNQVETTPSTVPVPKLDSHLPDIDLGSTNQLASDVQHGPIYDWFHRKQIKVKVNLGNVDTSGFFDEIAETIGANLPVLEDVLERIRWSQQKEYASATIHLDKRSPEDAIAVSRFCQALYDYSFVAKCFHLNAQNKIRLVLQNAPAIRRFFNGEWLEWHTLMSCLRYTKQRGKRFSCARGLEIELQNGDKYELDVFVLIDGQVPICIECKSGEFRDSIDRYLTLKKRLGIDNKHFLFCVAGLNEDNAKAFSAMYNLNFVSERSLSERLSHLY